MHAPLPVASCPVAWHHWPQRSRIASNTWTLSLCTTLSRTLSRNALSRNKLSRCSSLCLSRSRSFAISSMWCANSSLRELRSREALPACRRKQRGVGHRFGTVPKLTCTNKHASSMRVPSELLSRSTRKPPRSRPRTAVSKATSRSPSLMATRRNVACASAAMQWTSSSIRACSPLSVGLSVVSAFVSHGKGSFLLTAQNPPTGCSETLTVGVLGLRALGGAAKPLSSG
mmetsp:Transcript_24164/g.59978  ORF Transcript_24164/g.59978 Transcript_24164/m.59978 type:complete len:229 (-) Transcript_24164:589-1275(-)